MKSAIEKRIYVFLLAIALALFLLLGRLYFLQIINGDNYLKRSESNFIQERIIAHSRGKLLDQDGKILVDNCLSYDLYVTFALLPDSLKTARIIGQSLNLSKKDLHLLNEEILLRANHEEGQEIHFRENVPLEQCQDLAEKLRTQLISGVNITFLENDRCTIALDCRDFPTRKRTYRRLKRLLTLSKEDFAERWQKAENRAQGLARFKPTLLLSDIGFDAYAQIENAISLGHLAGLSVVPSKRRRYVYGDLATHAIGFLNQVSLDELRENSGYRSGDYIGRRGIEASFEGDLRGADGIERVIVDAKGRRFNENWEEELLGDSRITESKSGRNIVLSINADLQKAAQSFFLGRSGSIIVMEVNTGFIRAMASFPSFDPNLIVSSDNQKALAELMNDKERPFRNKAVQDHYAPGSLFKPITGIAGLKKGLINTQSKHYCSGSYSIHKTTWRCFKREGHGMIALPEAIKVSCDNFFYELGHRLGIESLASVATDFGFGKKTGIDLIGETAGILPSRDYYMKRLGYLYPGAVVNMSIGQGDLTVSPLQIVVALAAIANGGKVLKPQLIEKILDESGEIVQTIEPEVRSLVSDNNGDFKEIIESMSHVTEPGGSAYGIRYRPDFADIASWIKKEDIKVVGKTGTAQVVKLSKLVKHVDAKDVQYEHRDHAWFEALYPEESPEIAIVVMTEHAGMGGAMSAPVAIRLMRTWEEIKRNKQKLGSGS
jgi:penicillin-binding protein 2